MNSLLALLLLLSLNAHAEPLKGIYLNNEGAEALKANRVSLAQQKFLKALSENPKNYISRMNLGVTFIFDKELDKAIKEFDIPADAADSSDEVRYFAHFNKGRAYQDLKKADAALKNYQESLLYRKDSLETKANIELLVQQQNGQGKGGSGDEQENQQKQDQDQQGQGDQKDQKNDQQKDGDKEKEKNEKPQKPQDLSKKDIEKILEELKNQEQKIRALEYGKESKEEQNGKNW